MSEVIPTSFSHITFSTPTSHLFPVNLSRNIRQTFSSSVAIRVRCQPMKSVATQSEVKDEKKRKKSQYEIENLTTWLLKQEQAGNIDAELTVVLSSISLACKQIAFLLQRSSIINLAGGQGTIYIQGEDQKKLDVMSNELFCNCLRSSGRAGIIASVGFENQTPLIQFLVKKEDKVKAFLKFIILFI